MSDDYRDMIRILEQIEVELARLEQEVLIMFIEEEVNKN